MKKLPVWIIVVWCVLAVCGVLAIVIGALVKLPSLLQWLTGALILAADAVWVTLRLVLARPKKKQSNFFSGSQTVFARIARETNEAVNRYLSAVVRKGLLG
ncbi:MAG TPA: hypothetical protein VKF42_07875, partial [Chitinivibrionales bacterium]|nr:hypothetical protein [Chitinivibrionales bacterium]